MEPKFANLRTVEDISILKGTAFEEYLGSIFGDLGYVVDLTPASGDFGADLILSKDGNRIAVQAKQYAKPVGFDAVKEAHFARSYYSASQAWVIATHGFTPQAIKAAESTDVMLIDGKELLSLASKAIINAPATESSPHCDPAPIDSELLDACLLVATSGNTLPVYLQSELHVGPEKASKLLRRMDSLGITKMEANGTRSVVSKEELAEIIDDHYDASLTPPRFSTEDYQYEVFRGDGPDSITVVESPTKYPTFYSFELDPENNGLLAGWTCVGIDAVKDTSDIVDLQNRRGRVASLKLYNVFKSPETVEADLIGIERPLLATADFLSIAAALNDVRSGKSRIRKPGFVKRREAKRAAKETEDRECQQKQIEEARERNRQQAAIDREEDRAKSAAMRKRITRIAGIITLSTALFLAGLYALFFGIDFLLEIIG